MEPCFLSNYVAPECFEITEVDLSAYGYHNDIWSLGLLIFKLLFKRDLVPVNDPKSFFKE